MADNSDDFTHFGSIISLFPNIQPEKKTQSEKTSFLDSLEGKFSLELGSTEKVGGRRELKRQKPHVTSMVVEMSSSSGTIPVKRLKSRLRY